MTPVHCPRCGRELYSAERVAALASSVAAASSWVAARMLHAPAAPVQGLVAPVAELQRDLLPLLEALWCRVGRCSRPPDPVARA